MQWLAIAIFLLIGTILGYLAYRQIWAEAKRKVAPKGPLDPGNKAKRKNAAKKVDQANGGNDRATGKRAGSA